MKNKIVMLKKSPSKLIEALSILLADTYVLYAKTQNYHWNVVGEQFTSLHQLFETQYTQLALASDTIAERIRALNAKAPGTLNDFLKMTSLNEGHSNYSAAKMIHDLLTDHEQIAKNIVSVYEIAETAGDEVTMDMLIVRKEEHDKTAWMLRSILG